MLQKVALISSGATLIAAGQLRRINKNIINIIKITLTITISSNISISAYANLKLRLKVW